MTKRIVIIQGHPDPDEARYCHALASAYKDGAISAGHEVKTIDIAGLDFPILRSRAEWENEPPLADIKNAQNAMAWAQHVVIIYPLWLGGMPALLKGFLEQLMRPDFAFKGELMMGKTESPLSGRSARIVVTMGMPAFFYRWYYGAHSLKSLERNILHFVGMGPIRESLIGLVEGEEESREKWLAKVRALGEIAR